MDPPGSKVYVNNLIDTFGLRKRTIKEYKKALNDLFYDHPDYSFITTRDENGSNEYWHLSPKIFNKQIDEEGKIILQNKAVDNLNKLLSLYMAQEIVKKLEVKELKSEVEELFKNFTNSLRYKNDIQDLIKNIHKVIFFFWYAPKKSYNEDITKNILHGIIYKKVLKIRYNGLKHISEFSLKPIAIIVHQGLLYLLGSGKGRYRRKIYTYAIDRIESARFTGDSFKFNYDGFDPYKYTNKYIGVMTNGRKRRFIVVFENSKETRRIIQERIWFDKQEFEELKDGRLKMEFITYPTLEVKRWLLSFGNQVKVLKPEGFLNQS